MTNFGISQEDVDKQFALGQKFYELPLEEKLKFVPDLESGNYNGYRPAGRRLLSGDVKDKTEVWNMASEYLNLGLAIRRMLTWGFKPMMDIFLSRYPNFSQNTNKRLSLLLRSFTIKCLTLSTTL